MIMNCTLLGLLSLLLTLATCHAGEAPASDPDVQAGSNAHETADRFAAIGMTAMEESDGDPKRAVDAALAFSHALEMYQADGDDDSVRAMQANIFWCKKRMDLDSLNEFVAKKGDQQAYAQMIERILTEEVPEDQSAAYLARAQRFRDENPEHHFQIAIRFSEIIDRFPDSDEAKEAGVVFAREQSAYLAEVRKERQRDHERIQGAIDKDRRSRFALTPQANTGKAIPSPDQAALRAALATVKSLYKADLAKTKDPQKRATARKLANDAAKSREDAAVYYAMLQESIRLAGDSEDYLLLMADCEKMNEAFVDGAQFRQELIKRRSKPTAAAILKLLDDPKDKPANTQAGRFFCFSLGAWDSGLALLSLGDDPALHAVAEMELAEPANDVERKVIGDAWYEYGRKNAGDRIAAWGRSMFWYEKFRASADGVAKVQIEQRMAEMEKTLPMVITDFSRITAEQWDRLKATPIVVKATGGRTPTGILLEPGRRVRIVPHPTDTWVNAYYMGSYQSTWTGFDWKAHNNAARWEGMEDGGRFVFGALICQVSSNPPQSPGIITGSGALYLMPYQGSSSYGRGESGAIRVKILPVVDED